MNALLRYIAETKGAVQERCRDELAPHSGVGFSERALEILILWQIPANPAARKGAKNEKCFIKSPLRRAGKTAYSFVANQEAAREVNHEVVAT
ncbi:hypothetical protein FHW96_001535 [Novosphingobium sp. SG751A]|nr:hypothetical protein [Novosphingobium sp. SG751A]